MQILTDLNTAFETDEAAPALAFLPIGATEQHSRHLPLATDTLLGDALSARILEQVDRPETALLLRTLPISSSEENTGFCGTISFTPMTMRGLVRDAWDSVHRSGVRWLVVAAWHGGNFIIKPTVRELNHGIGRCGVIYLNPWEHVPAEEYERFGPGFEVHCGDVETSLMLALWPETVRDERRDNPVEFAAIWQDMFSMKTLSGGEGHAGHPTRADAEKGRRLADIVVEKSARYLERILAMAEEHGHY
jgi:creatinine amidohydrolase